MFHAVIMAGGAGTRFWPESRAAMPKQLLSLAGSRSMIQMTVDRLGELIPPERVLVVTNQRLVAAIGEQLPSLPARAILGEPCKRDTAPCIGLAALLLSREDPDATMAVLPADQVIRPDAAFQTVLDFAARLVEQQPEVLVTFGIRPTYPAESFGYIQRGEPLAAGGEASHPAYRVARFREKPDAETARSYLASGDFYWNAGIFVWKASTILAALSARQPEMVQHLTEIADALDTPDFAEVFAREFEAIEGISIDYAVLEHHPEIAVVEAPYEWSDVGSWQSLARLHGTDEQGNTILAKHLGHNTQGSIIRGADDHLIATVGVSDLVIVHTPDATLVANKHDEESIRKLVKLLEQRGWESYL